MVNWLIRLTTCLDYVVIGMRVTRVKVSIVKLEIMATGINGKIF